MAVAETTLQIGQSTQPGYVPIVQFEHWKTALINYDESFAAENITEVHRHLETDEVFVLLQGSCVLFVMEPAARARVLQAVRMEPLKLYNVRKGVWHTNVLTPGSVVLIVENSDTTRGNSPRLSLTDREQELLRALAAKYHGEA